jgi:hypothetical protein
MKTENKINRVANMQLRLTRLLVMLVCCALFATATNAQQTAGGTQIQNQASATYSDGSGNNYSTVSNTVSVTVANVSGLAITPDGGSRASIVPGQQDVLYTFRVTNTGNFADQVRFLANGQSIQLTGSATLAAAVIDADGSGGISAGDINILTNSSDIISAAIAQNGYIDVIVAVNVSSSATPGSVIRVQLGDTTTGAPTFDNQAANTSANEVRTVSTTSVNGLREARGDVSATVDADAQLLLNLTAPAGPVTLGSTINYVWEVCNTGLRDAQSITLINAPSGSNTGVFIIAPIPVGTSLTAGQTFPAGTLYSTSPLTISPLEAVYTTSAPSDLSTVRRVAFRVGSSLATDTCAPSINMAVTITTDDATLDIFQIGDAFANNNVGGLITDQSGDTVANAGDGNANFTEGSQPGSADGDGIVLRTILQRLGAVLIGPAANAGATGPTSQNDDYTNRSVTTGITGVAFGETTTAPGTVIYTNTIRNTGNATDTFSLTAPAVPNGFTVEISTDGGASYTTVVPGSGSVSITLGYGQEQNILVRITAPSGLAVLQDGGFSSVIRATSTTTPDSFNETIDRLYTGVLRMDKTATITNDTGVGGANDPVPGAVIEYTIVYKNIASTGGSGNSSLTISNVVITENGNTAPNNWGSTTDQVVGSASDTLNGTITGDSVGSSALTDTIQSLAPQQTGTFKFRRVIR